MDCDPSRHRADQDWLQRRIGQGYRDLGWTGAYIMVSSERWREKMMQIPGWDWRAEQ